MGVINIRVWARKAHRRLGLGCMVVLIGLSVTGIILNHPDTYKLQDDYIPFWMSDMFYRSEFPDIHSYPVGEDWLTQMNGELHFNGIPVARCPDRFSAGVMTADFYAASCGDNLVLLDPDGSFHAEIHVSQTPLDELVYVSLCESSICIFSRGITYRYAPDNTPDWVRSDSFPRFPIYKTEPREIRRVMLEEQISEQFSWHRVVEDLHSGELGGAWGVLIVDTTWIFTIIICVTGIYIWLIQLRRRTWD